MSDKTYSQILEESALRGDSYATQAEEVRAAVLEREGKYADEALTWKNIAASKDKILMQCCEENERLKVELANMKAAYDRQWAADSPWVLASERMPTEEDFEPTGECLGEFSGGIWGFSKGGSHRVIRWMRIPPPPTEEKDAFEEWMQRFGIAAKDTDEWQLCKMAYEAGRDSKEDKP